ncbi:MAG TPA: gliding motility-associated C-terminal domain-containing protein [Robiginitalea sp.]|nr:gliding motility-associated C-terminal domain-containing protein [Robiginitalea sp.]
MRRIGLIAALLLIPLTRGIYAQEGIANYGAMQLHGQGGAGFHADFANLGPFESPQGLVGFYSDSGSLLVSGSETPNLYDVEFSSLKGIWLEIPLQIGNNGNLIRGDLRTSRKEDTSYPLFTLNSFYTGESSVSKVDGYAGMEHKQEFTFPVGDDTRLRWLRIESQALNARVRCAYFFEDPADSPTLGLSIKADPDATGLRVSQTEFWRINGDIPSRVTLSWDEQSNVPGLAPFLADLRVVGYNRTSGAWEDLGNSHVEGGRDYGTLTSEFFVPSRYEVITFGGSTETESFQVVQLDNYYLSPNGDGRNETLEIPAARQYTDNAIQIYNRHGQLVFQQDHYTGGFDGLSNVELTVRRDKGLEPGIYFYLITFNELRQQHQGYFYLSN